jgi:hypothetical protein
MISRFFANKTFTGILVFLFLFLMAAGAFIFLGYTLYYEQGSQSWPVAEEAKVVSAKHKTVIHDNRTSHIPKIRYRYRVGADWYTGDRLAFGFANRSMEDTGRLMDEFKSRHHLRVHYDPANPANSVLQPGFHGINVLALVFAELGMGFVFLARYFDARFNPNLRNNASG